MLAPGIMILDAGMQGMQISNQTVIYGLPGGRSRLNSAYMVSAFLGASVGSYLAGEIDAHYGWIGGCWLGGLLGVAILIPAWAWRSTNQPVAKINGVDAAP